MYALAPLSFAALWRQDPDRRRPFRLPAERVLGPVSFAAANLIFYRAGWPTDWRLLAAMVIGVLVVSVSVATRRPSERPTLDLRTGRWVLPWLGGMGVISYLGQFGGRRLLPFWWDLGVVTAFSLSIYAAALATRRPGTAVRAELDALMSRQAGFS